MQTHSRGMTLIDVIVGSALVLIIFLALMGILRASILVSNLAKARAGAASLASSQMEYLRGLSYDALGTIGGIPPGIVPPTSTVVIDNTTYVVHTYIQYIDDPADGLGTNDTNGIITDYKLAKIKVSYTAGGGVRSAALLSNFAPPGIETTNGGGTLAIHIVNATGAPVPGATVHIIDASTTPAVNLSTFSNVKGMVYLPGAATSTQYQIFVSKGGYSKAQTYVRNTTNQNPTPGYLTVVKDQTTTGTFAIDLLASLTLNTYSPAKSGIFSDTFTGTTNLATTTNTIVSGGALTLANNVLSGSARSIAVAPTYLRAWGVASISTSTPLGTSVLVHLYNTNTGTLVPDTMLPGNVTGFSTSQINLSGVSTSTYPSLALLANLSATATTTIPQVLKWSLGYTAGPYPLPNAAFTLTGTKIIGSTGSGVPIYKTIISTTTNSIGSRILDLPWDSYTLTAGSYDIENVCPVPPYSLSPGTSNTATLTLLTPPTGNRLFVSVQDASGNTIPGVSVTLSESGYTHTITSSLCGGTYFGNISAGKNYTITITKNGYTTTIFSNINISGQTIYVASFP